MSSDGDYCAPGVQQKFFRAKLASSVSLSYNKVYEFDTYKDI
jgi:hypothetical protein